MKKTCIVHTPQIIGKLKSLHLKVTPIRIALLDTLEHAQEPLRVKDIVKEVKSDIVTVYRNLQNLMQLGLVSQLFLDQKEAYFELTSHKHHHHAICENCGRMVDIHDLGHHKLEQEALKASGFARIARHSLEFFGLCKDCYQKIGKNSSTT
jgi:Fur family transcriptional regulator, peroxide stress response regulator